MPLINDRKTDRVPQRPPRLWQTAEGGYCYAFAPDMLPTPRAQDATAESVAAMLAKELQARGPFAVVVAIRPGPGREAVVTQLLRAAMPCLME